jgi:precorrin-6A/cobalt-precorrin-6A reductase
MILLLGGTSETAAVAEALAVAGQRVLVSTATDVPLNVGCHANIRRRCGRLDAAAMADLVRCEGIRALVDVSHPYAVELRATAERVAQEVGIPYLTYVRPEGAMAGDGVRVVAGHADAARVACESGKPVLLTVGSRNVALYAREAQHHHVTLIVRVLPHKDSISACLDAGIVKERIVTARGPFGVEENRALIRQFDAGVLVTKDSGAAGGFPAKRDAARLEACRLVVVGRKPQRSEKVFGDTNALVRAVLDTILKRGAQ